MIEQKKYIKKKLCFFQRCPPSNCRNDKTFSHSLLTDKMTNGVHSFFSSQSQYLLHRKLYRKLPRQSFSTPKFWSGGGRWKSILINPRFRCREAGREGGKAITSHPHTKLGHDRIFVGSQPYTSPLWSQGVPSPLV